MTTDVTGILSTANGGTGFTTTLKTTVTQSVASVTPTTITEFTTASLGAGTYKFNAVIVAQSTAAGTGMGFRMNAVGATMTTCYAKWLVAQGTSGNNHDYGYDQITPTTNITSTASPAANTDILTTVDGTFTISIGGTVAIQLRSETGPAVSIRAGSYLTIEAI